MNRWHLAMVAMIFLLAAVPAYAYGDPSGGTLFQVLMPALAALWAAWMIFANRVRHVLMGAYRRLRGAVSDEPTS
jgi:hypothetical protein